jgi:hypothetical protein
MIDNIERLMLDQFRVLRAEVASVKDDTREMKTRLVVIEAGISSLRRDNGDFATSKGVAPPNPARNKS